VGHCESTGGEGLTYGGLPKPRKQERFKWAVLGDNLLNLETETILEIGGGGGHSLVLPETPYSKHAGKEGMREHDVAVRKEAGWGWQGRHCGRSKGERVRTTVSLVHKAEKGLAERRSLGELSDLTSGLS